MDIAAIKTEEDSIAPQDIVNGDGTPSLRYLQQLRAAALPEIDQIAQGIQLDFQLRCEISSKRDIAAAEKAKRPATLEKYPWFTLAHIRDYLRFRTHLLRATDFTAVLSRFADLQSTGKIGIVKIDTAKLARPGAFGWRMIATDLRVASSGLIVEHYMTFGEMIAVNEDWLHAVYEKWRTKAPDRMTIIELASRDRDAQFSRHANREMLLDGILRGRPANDALQIDRMNADKAIVGSLLKSLKLR